MADKGGKTEFVIKKHEHKTIPKGSVCVLIGRRGSGKSVTVKSLCYHFRNVPHFIVLSKTERNNKFFGDFVPERCIVHEWDKNLLSRLFATQDNLIKKYGKDDPRTHVVLVIDDFLYDKKLWKQKEVMELMMNGRHRNITVIFTVQYAIGIGPEIRSQIDFAFIYAQETISEKKKVFEHFVCSFDRLSQFTAVLDAVTENFQCLVANRQQKSRNIEQKIFRYKAPMNIPPFKVGDPIFWGADSSYDSRVVKNNGLTIMLE